MAETEWYSTKPFTSALTTWRQDSSVGVVTTLRARRSGDRTGRGRDFPYPKPAMEPNETPVKWVQGAPRG